MREKWGTCLLKFDQAQPQGSTEFVQNESFRPTLRFAPVSLRSFGSTFDPNRRACLPLRFGRSAGKRLRNEHKYHIVVQFRANAADA